MHMTEEVVQKHLCVPLVDTQFSDCFCFGVIVIQTFLGASVLHNHS